MRELASTERNHEQHDPGGEHLVARRDKRVARRVQARREKGPERPRERRAEQHERTNRIDRSIQAARYDEDRDADKSKQHTGEQVASHSLPGDHPIEHDPEGDRRHDEGGDSRRDCPLGEDDQAVAAGEHQHAHGGRAAELAARDAQVDTSECEPRGQEEAGEHKTDPGVKQRR